MLNHFFCQSCGSALVDEFVEGKVVRCPVCNMRHVYMLSEGTPVAEKRTDASIVIEPVNEADFVIEYGVLVEYKGKGGDIVLPEGITSIRTYEEGGNTYSIFRKSPSVKSIVLPSSMKKINDCAFSHCSSLESVTIPKSVTSIGSAAFHCCRSLQSITIPESVTSIGELTFTGCRLLQSVTIADSVTSIGEFTFTGCRLLQSVTIPKNVTSIGENAFWDCGSLEAFAVADDNPSYCSVDGVLFTKDGRTVVAYPCGRRTTDYRIPDSVTSISERVFEGCESLKSVTIGNGVTSISERAFSDCSSLESVTNGNSVTRISWRAFDGCSSLTIRYRGSRFQWWKIEKGERAIPKGTKIKFVKS